MTNKLFVGGLAWATKEDSLRDFFAQVGTVVSATVITDKYTGKSKGFGFVEMSTEDEARDAIEKLNGQSLDGRAITVNEARPQVPRDNSRGGYGSRNDNYRRDDNRGNMDSNNDDVETY